MFELKGLGSDKSADLGTTVPVLPEVVTQPPDPVENPDGRTMLPLASNFDVNQYITKKTVTQGMMDVALLMSNAAQLKALLEVGKEHPYFYLLIVLVVMSITIQVIVGVIFLILGKTSIVRDDKQLQLDKLNNIVTIFVFFLTVINIFIGSFGISARPEATSTTSE